MIIDQKLREVFQAYHERIKSENTLMSSLSWEETMQRRDEFLLPVGKEVGQFLNAMIRSANAKVILEVGTSYGYSTLWLTEAARAIGGKVITLELDEAKAEYAKTQLTKAGIAGFVEFRIGDALSNIGDSKETFDFVLIDLWKALYVPTLELILPKLNLGAYVVADNMLHPPAHEQEAADYRRAIRDLLVFDSVLLPIGSGIEVSQMVRDPKS